MIFAIQFNNIQVPTTRGLYGVHNSTVHLHFHIFTGRLSRGPLPPRSIVTALEADFRLGSTIPTGKSHPEAAP
jgi:hypothetical protein